MTRPMRSHAGVVVLHDATPGDSSALQGLRSASIIYAGDGLPGQDGMPGSGLLPVDGARVAEDETGLLGSYGLLVRTGAGRAARGWGGGGGRGGGGGGGGDAACGGAPARSRGLGCGTAADCGCAAAGRP